MVIDMRRKEKKNSCYVLRNYEKRVNENVSTKTYPRQCIDEKLFRVPLQPQIVQKLPN